MPGRRAHAVNRGFVRTVLRGRDGLEVVISPDEAFVPIGERLNPTNKPRLQRGAGAFCRNRSDQDLPELGSPGLGWRRRGDRMAKIGENCARK